MEIVWKDHYELGVKSLDDDHKKLFSIAEKISKMAKNPNANEETRLFMMREGVKYLKSSFAEHAAREEAFMQKQGYADYENHKRLHDDFQQVHIGKFEELIESETCTKEQIFEFVGMGMGWLLEHISIEDMAIVGKGVLCKPKAPEINQQALEQEINMLFAATLNLNINAYVIDANYKGQNFENAIYQRFTYDKHLQPVNIISGIEKAFLIHIAQSIYGDELTDADVLILSSMEIFGATFWRTLGERLVNTGDGVNYRSSTFLSQKQIKETFAAQKPAVSILFGSDWGKFFFYSENHKWDQKKWERNL